MVRFNCVCVVGECLTVCVISIKKDVCEGQPLLPYVPQASKDST